MIKKLKPSELAEGDWIANEIKVGGKIFIKENKNEI